MYIILSCNIKFSIQLVIVIFLLVCVLFIWWFCVLLFCWYIYVLLFCLFVSCSVCLFVCLFVFFSSIGFYSLTLCIGFYYIGVLFYCFLMYSWFPHWVPTTIFSHISFISQIFLKNSNAKVVFFFFFNSWNKNEDSSRFFSVLPRWGPLFVWCESSSLWVRDRFLEEMFCQIWSYYRRIVKNGKGLPIWYKNTLVQKYLYKERHTSSAKIFVQGLILLFDKVNIMRGNIFWIPLGQIIQNY